MESTSPHRIPLEMDNRTPGQPVASSSSPAEAPASASGEPGEPLLPGRIEEIEEQIVAVLRTCYDPEIPVNVHELGLIYGVEVDPFGNVLVRMTLTSPACPVAGSLPPEIQAKLGGIPGVRAAKVEVVWDPPWHQDRMSDAAKLQLGLF